MKKRMLIMILPAMLIAGCATEESPGRYDSTEDIERAIRDGELGEELAQRGTRVDDLYVREIANTDIPYKVFSFSDYKAGYSVLVYEGRLVLLCAGFGGGYARDMKLHSQDGKQVLTYKCDVGSGASHELSGQYVLGSDKATWQNWNDMNPYPIPSADG
jgi:hypothetical protein